MASPFLILEVSCEERSSTQLPPSGIQNDCYCKVPTYSTFASTKKKRCIVFCELIYKRQQSQNLKGERPKRVCKNRLNEVRIGEK